jgi:UDP-sulfoquinovose synthase
MKVFIAGIDGYLGWALAQSLLQRGHEVAGADNMARRSWVEEIGSWSAVPIAPIQERIRMAGKIYGHEPLFSSIDLCDFLELRKVLHFFKPDAVVHLGQCPSAPYSMIDQAHAVFVQNSNLVSTLNLIYAIREACPEAHFVKLGTMGEYGTPGIDIPEGEFEITFRGRSAVLPFPRQANSWYHLSKVHDSHNLAFAARIWGLAITDLMQGVVYGASVRGLELTGPQLATRLDFDSVFGTVVHRFCAQAVIGKPLSIYGKGGQRRGFIALTDSVRCMTVSLENPPQPGEYRVFNQISQVCSILDIAKTVREQATKKGIEVNFDTIKNPRTEAEEHYYQPDAHKLRALGFVPLVHLCQEVDCLLDVMAASNDRIRCKQSVLAPKIPWK